MSQFDQLSDFWQGVAASITAALILTVLGYMLKISVRQLRESSAKRGRLVSDLGARVRSSDPSEKTEASLIFILFTFKNFFFGNILWVLTEAAGPFAWNESVYLFVIAIRFGSLLFFVFGLQWIYRFINALQIPKEF